jgi:hypothetical protein
MENECVLQNSTYIYFPCFYGMTPTKSPTHLSHKTSSTVCTREWLLSSLEFQMIFKYIANCLSKCSTVEFVFYNYVKHLWLKMKHIQWNRKHYQQKCIKTMQYVCLYNNVAKLSKRYYYYYYYLPVSPQPKGLMGEKWWRPIFSPLAVI